MPLPRSLATGALVALVAGVAACGDDDDKPELPADARIQVASRDVYIPVGDSLDLGASLVNAAGGAIAGFPVSYTAVTTAPFTVSATGRVRGVSPGGAWVRIAAGGRVLDSVEVSVVTHPAGTVDQTRALGDRPYGVAISRTGVAYVTRLDMSAVQRAVVSTSTLQDSIRVGFIPNGVTFNADGSLAFVANQNSGSMSIIDVATRAVVATPAIPGSPVSVTVAPNQQRVYVGSSTGKVYSVNIATRAIVDSVLVGSLPQRIVFSRDGSRYWTADAFANLVAEVNVAANSVTRSYPVGGIPQDLAITRNETRLFVANEAGRVDVIDLTANAPLTPITMPSAVFGIAISPDQKVLYATNQFSNTVQVIDVATRALGTPITVGGAPRRVAFDRYGTRAVVASEGGSVSFIR